MLKFLLMVLGRDKGNAEVSDEDLMERFRDGDARAFESLLERHERKIFNFIFRFVRNRELANDLLQETFLRVVKNAKRYTRKAKFTTWLYTIARNQSIDALRRQQHRRHRSLDPPSGKAADGPTLLERVPGQSPDGLERTDAHQISARISAAIDELSEEQREVFVMREVQQLKFKEIAEVIGVSENTIKSRMRYALENLRLALADYAPNQDESAAASSRRPRSSSARCAPTGRRPMPSRTTR